MKVTDEMALTAIKGQYRIPQQAKICYARYQIDEMKLALKAVFSRLENKEHNHVTFPDNLKEAADEEMKNPNFDLYHFLKKTDNEGWIEWNGGEQPVEDNVRIEVKYKCGRSYPGWVKNGSIAKEFTWSHGWGISDIVAYRVLPDCVISTLKSGYCYKTRDGRKSFITLCGNEVYGATEGIPMQMIWLTDGTYAFNNKNWDLISEYCEK